MEREREREREAGRVTETREDVRESRLERVGWRVVAVCERVVVMDGKKAVAKFLTASTLPHILGLHGTLDGPLSHVCANY